MDSQPNPTRMGNQWVWPDGKVLPVISGGSDDGLNLPTVIPGLDSDDDELSEFARGILNEIPEEDRSIVQKHIKTWDGNVTKKFQEYTGKLKPYEELGSLEDVQAALEVIQLMNEDPLEFYNQITAALNQHGILKEDAPMTDFNLPEYEGLPEPVVQKIQQLEEMLSGTSSRFDEFMASQEEAKVMQQVDSLLSTLHNKHGEFDEDWVLMQMSRGVAPDDAVKAFHSNVVQKYSSPRKPPAALLGGAGSVPSGQADFSKMTQQEKKAWAVQQLQALND